MLFQITNKKKYLINLFFRLRKKKIKMQKAKKQQKKQIAKIGARVKSGGKVGGELAARRNL